MVITDALKTWMRENRELPEDASDEDIQKAVAMAMAEDALSADQFIELTKDPEADKANQFIGQIDKFVTALEERQSNDREQQKQLMDSLAKLIEAQTPKEEPKPKEAKMPKLPDNFGTTIVGDDDQANDDTKVRHITADKRYDSTTRELYFSKSHRANGERLYDGGTDGKRYLHEPSELERAVVGACAKRMLLPAMYSGVIPKHVYTDHDHELFQYAVHNLPWCGTVGGENGTVVNYRKLEPHEQKAVYDDTTSGGSYIVPNVFDDAVVLTPLVHGMLYPKVNVITIPRGSVVQGGTVQNPSESAWGANEATAIPLETTTSFIGQFNTNIRTWHGAIEIGRDFLEDTPVNFGDIVAQRYGEVLLNQLDSVIADGNGTTEPAGIFGTSGISTSTAADPWTMTHIEACLFGVAYEYRAATDKNRVAFICTETTYSRLRGIAVGAADQRRVLGMTHEDMMILGHPVAINALGKDATATSNTHLLFANLAHYRMYRRAGLRVEVSTEGRTLRVANQLLISCQARYGGRLELGGYGHRANSGPA